jgi:hypothetical protein
MSTGYFVYAEDLTLIADAIRAKTETTNLLSFPEGFISGIDAIQVPPENPLPEFTYSSTNYQVIDDGNGDWRIKFNATGTFRVTSQVTVDIFVVGGGGGGSSRWAGTNSSTGLDQGRGAGGGGGYTTTERNFVLMPNTDYKITIGAGGTQSTQDYNACTGTAGGTSSFANISAAGGKGGGLSGSYGVGGNGGSGGAGYPGYTGGQGSGAYKGGVDGGDGVGNSGYAGKGQGTTTREFGETTGTLYSTGGDYYRSIANIVAVKANTGDGGDGGANNGSAGVGASGIVVIRNARG